MIMFGRIVIPTKLDPIPRPFRAVPGHIALNPAEIEAINAELAAPSRTPGPKFREVLAIILEEDNLEAENLERMQRRRRKRP